MWRVAYGAFQEICHFHGDGVRAIILAPVGGEEFADPMTPRLV